MDQSNIDDVFSQMLGELDGITQELDEITIAPEIKKTAPKYDLSPSRNSKPDNQVTDFDEEDVNLTAMLNDLCSFEETIMHQQDDLMGLGRGNGVEHKFNAAILSQQPPPQTTHLPPPPPPQQPNFNAKPSFGLPPSPIHQRGGAEESLEALSAEIDQDQQQPVHKELTEDELAHLSPEEREERIRSEKVRIALEKMKEARVQKLVVKVFNKDNSSKTMVIDERMTTRDVMVQLIEKNHFDYSANWALVEEMPSLFLERMCEEHEKPCETMKYWTRNTTNQLRFLERKDKYALFKNPQHYLLTSSDQQEKMHERQKQTLIEEFFSGKGPSSGVPEVQGYLHIKNGKSWSRKFCVLRRSGLYVSKSGEPKRGKKMTDLICLVMFEQTYLYIGHGWKKKFKAPFEYGFALKHPAFQTKSKHVRYLACEDFKSLMRWTVGIRLAKYGRDLMVNYEKTNEEVKSHTNVPALKIGYKHEQTPDKVSAKSNDLANNKASTLPRTIGVKNMFEGAWQRANKTDKPIHDQSIFASPTIQANRAKSTWKTPQKKTNNWWELQNDQPAAEEVLAVQASPSHPVRNSMPSSATPQNETLPPPPPADSFPPPPLPASSFAPPASGFAPPPPVSPKPANSTFTSFDDPLPPPPPAMTSPVHPPPASSGAVPPKPSRGGYKPPPPAVPPKSGRSPQHYDNNIGRTAF